MSESTPVLDESGLSGTYCFRGLSHHRICYNMIWPLNPNGFFCLSVWNLPRSLSIIKTHFKETIYRSLKSTVLKGKPWGTPSVRDGSPLHISIVAFSETHTQASTSRARWTSGTRTPTIARPPCFVNASNLATHRQLLYRAGSQPLF